MVASSVLTLAFTGLVILMAHPRLYWGVVGNDLTPSLLELPISKNYHHGGWVKITPIFEGKPDSPVSGVRRIALFNKNGWGRSLHFLAAWFLVSTGGVYVLAGIATGHFWRNLMPRARELTPRSILADLIDHAHLRIAPTNGGPPYGTLQKLAYCGVTFVAVPMMVVTGLSMAPALTAACPWLSDVFGGSQSARTIHFFIFGAIVLFVGAHVFMEILSGFKTQMRAMIGGQ